MAHYPEGMKPGIATATSARETPDFVALVADRAEPAVRRILG